MAVTYEKMKGTVKHRALLAGFVASGMTKAEAAAAVIAKVEEAVNRDYTPCIVTGFGYTGISVVTPYGIQTYLLRPGQLPSDMGHGSYNPSHSHMVANLVNIIGQDAMIPEAGTSLSAAQQDILDWAYTHDAYAMMELKGYFLWQNRYALAREKGMTDSQARDYAQGRTDTFSTECKQVFADAYPRLLTRAEVETRYEEETN